MIKQIKMERILQITSGRGPAECCWVVAQVLKYVIATAKEHQLEASTLHREKGPENGTLYSATVQISGKNVEAFISEWSGTIQWIGKSPYRKFHKRKNWFVGVQEIKMEQAQFELKRNEIRFDTYRSGGPGGQHVNKVSSAVRAKHLPTGLYVEVSEHRSQQQNKKLAIQRLGVLLQLEKTKAAKSNAQNNWQNHNELKRGNPVKVFEGTDFKKKRKKNIRKQERLKSKRDLKQWDTGTT